MNRFLTKKPQLAGTPADEELAKFVYNEWRLSGINASLVNYTVLLSYPNVTNPNLVIIYNIISVFLKHKLNNESYYKSSILNNFYLNKGQQN